MKPSVSQKIHRITAHPMGMFLTIMLFLEGCYYFLDLNPMAYFVIWILLSGIMGWRIMKVPNVKLMSVAAIQKSHYQVAAGVVFSILFLGLVCYLEISNVLHYAFNFMGFSLVYVMRNRLYL
jgi:hypothetical protein